MTTLAVVLKRMRIDTTSAETQMTPLRRRALGNSTDCRPSVVMADNQH